MKRYEWTSTRVDRLVEMWRAGYSSREIADELDTTHEGVRTKVRKLRRDGYNLLDRRFIKTSIKRRPNRNPVIRRSKPKLVAELRAVAEPHQPCLFINGHVPKRPAEPDWCGKPRAVDSQYCPEHHKKCHIKYEDGPRQRWRKRKVVISSLP